MLRKWLCPSGYDSRVSLTLRITHGYLANKAGLRELRRVGDSVRRVKMNGLPITTLLGGIKSETDFP